MRRPWGASVSPRSARLFRTTAVEERAARNPKKTPSVGENPAKPGRTALKPPVVEDVEVELAPDRPVNVVSWGACTDVTARLGLVLPSEEQWEYAARGGTDSPWWTGIAREDVRRVGNANLMPDPGLDDGEPGLAPVTSEAPNPFGLVGVLGNVTEWTSTETHYYGLPPGVGGPLASKSARYVGRGSSFARGPQEARSGFRLNRGGEGFAVEMLGLRPARPVERE